MCSEDTVRIPLYARDGSVRAYALVDAADADWVNQWRWILFGKYATRTARVNGRRLVFRLHRELLGLAHGDPLTGDHINRDKLDNRRTNLRVIPKSGQSQNMPSIEGSSRYRGVSWKAQHRKWVAYARINGKPKTLGVFDTEEEAAQVAREARRVHMPYAVD